MEKKSRVAMSKDDLRVIVREWHAGTPLQKIAEQIGVSTRTLNTTISTLRKREVDLPKRRVGPGQSVYNDANFIAELNALSKES